MNCDFVPEPSSEFSDSGEVELVSFACSESDPAAVVRCFRFCRCAIN